jgi:endonuclease/exonuclease/phosphatase family metal-dependent hydrolase
MKKWLYYITIFLSCLFISPLLTAPIKIAEIPSSHYSVSQNYIHLKGLANEISPSDKITTFSLNTCFAGSFFPLLYGGVKPWNERIPLIIKMIKDSNADVVCLQEVYDAKAANLLYDSLKTTYANFYIDIGPKTIGNNSGLFIASKTALKNPKFIPYSDQVGSQRFVNKGLFTCEIPLKQKTLHLFATHLYPSKNDFASTDQEKSIREKELSLITQKMQNISKKDPILLVADANLPFSSEEYQTSLLKENFKTTNQPKNTCITAYLINYFWTEKKDLKNNPAITIDYQLLAKNHPGKIQTKSLDTFDLKNPQNSLSDHKALYSTVYLS